MRDLDRHNGAAPILSRAHLASPRFDRQNPTEHLQPLPNRNRHCHARSKLSKSDFAEPGLDRLTPTQLT
jgi:hypothetical protein